MQTNLIDFYFLLILKAIIGILIVNNYDDKACNNF